MAAINADAKQVVVQFLNTYGLGSLANWAWGVYTGAGGGSTGISAITNELPTTSQFKARFPAYHQLAEEGRAMSVDQMLQYETTARQIMHAAGIPAGFYDTPQDFAQFMLHDVSTSELESRVQAEQQATLTAPQDVRDMLKNYYGVDQGHLTAFFLDPDKALPIIQQRYTAAQIGAEATRTGYGNINQDQALHLARTGVTDAQAAQGFNKLGLEAGLFQSQVTGEQAIGQNTQLSAEFDNNAQAQLAFQQRAATRKAAFAGDTGFQRTQQGVGGLAPAQKGA